MKQIKNYLKIGVLLLVILITSVNCEKEEILITNNEQNELLEPELAKRPLINKKEEITKAKLWFEQNPASNNFKILEFAETIDWKNAFVSSNADTYAIEVPIVLNNKTNIGYKSNKKSKTFNRLLILPSTKKHKYKSYIVNFLKFNGAKSFKNNLPNMNYFKVPESFDGYISVANSKNEIIELKEFEKGKFKSAVKSESKKQIANKFSDVEEIICIYLGWEYEDGTFEHITLVGCYSSGGGGSDAPTDSETDYGNYGGGRSTTTAITTCSTGYKKAADGTCTDCDTGYIKDANGYCVEVTVDNTPPDCSSFNYSRVGANDWQCAGVSGIHELFSTFGWDCIGFDFGSLPRALYFQLPINSTYGENTGFTAVESAIYLQKAFKRFDGWYQSNACTTTNAVMTQKFLEYIKYEFEEVGGNATLTPPQGFTGTITPYKYTWSGYGNCN